MRIVVTGCRGQLGTELCRQFGPEACGLDLPEFDLTCRHSVVAALEAIRPEVVINAAAFTRVDEAEREVSACRAVNVEGVVNLVEACRACCATLVQISTDYVFGGDEHRRNPYRETDPPAPQGVYARSKLDGERAAAEYPRHLIVRTCGLYGRVGERSAGNFVETMLRLGASGKRLRVVNDQCCTPSYVVHVVRAIRFLVESGAHGLYHVTNTGQATWYEFALEIFRQARRDVWVDPVSSTEWGAPAPRPAYSVLDCSKYLGLPGAPPMPPWPQALAEYLAERAEREPLATGH